MKGAKIIRWTEEEQDMLVDFVKKNALISGKDCEALAKTINECIWEGNIVRTSKAVSLRINKIRLTTKAKRPAIKQATTPTLPDPEPKDELNMAELGESIYEYIGSLIKKSQQLGDEVSVQQKRVKQTIEHYKSIVKDKDATIAQLNQRITNLNSKIHHPAANKKFSLSEIATRR